MPTMFPYYKCRRCDEHFHRDPTPRHGAFIDPWWTAEPTTVVHKCKTPFVSGEQGLADLVGATPHEAGRPRRTKTE